MKRNKNIIITGAAGFIGSNLVKELNKRGMENIILVDHLTDEKKKNIQGLKYKEYVDKDKFLKMVKGNKLANIGLIFHLGARTDTAERNKEFLLKVNTEYSKNLFIFALLNNCRFIYASSAATYGNGSNGYSDKERNLKPLNYYGLSKYLFDEWVLDQKKKPLQWVGLKFFNVYGPNEYHKGFMSSVVYHGFKEIEKSGKIRLFKSYKKDCSDGEQKRDFIYVKDVLKIMLFFLDHKNLNGIYNVGTGKAQTFLDLGNALFRALGKKPKIHFIDMPKRIKEKYQYFTQADITSLRKVGYKETFYELEDGISDYVKNCLSR